MTDLQFPDIEDLVTILLDSWFADEPAPPIVVTEFPEWEVSGEAIKRGAEYVCVQRTGGAPVNRVQDAPVVMITGLSPTRKQSMDRLAALSTRLAGWSGDVPLSNGTVATVIDCKELQMPLRQPDTAPGVRPFVAQFQFKTRKPRP